MQNTQINSLEELAERLSVEVLSHALSQKVDFIATSAQMAREGLCDEGYVVYTAGTPGEVMAEVLKELVNEVDVRAEGRKFGKEFANSVLVEFIAGIMESQG